MEKPNSLLGKNMLEWLSKRFSEFRQGEGFVSANIDALFNYFNATIVTKDGNSETAEIYYETSELN